MIASRIAMYLAIFGLGIWTTFALRAQTEPEYEFTVDWVTNNVENWTQHLGDLRGEAALRALEIGSYEGRSAIWFLEEILTHPSSRITAVDLFGVSEIESRFDRNIVASGVAHKVDKIKGNSQEVLPGLRTQRFDFIYIDGSHTARDVLLDAALSWGLLKEGGLLIFDDYRLRLEWHPSRRPKLAIDAFLKIFEPYLEVVHFGYQVIVRRKYVSEITPLPVKRTLGGWDAWLYLLTGTLGTAIYAAVRPSGNTSGILLRAVAAVVGAGALGWAYSQDFKIFSQLKEVAGFNAFSTLGGILPAVSGTILSLLLFWLWDRWRQLS